MYSKFNHILTSSKNKEINVNAVAQLAKAKHIHVDPHAVSLAVEAELKKAVEQNIVGSRYLTGADMLHSANMYIVSNALRELELHQALASETVENAPQQEHTFTSRRREIQMNDRSFEIPRASDPAPVKRTPRYLLSQK
jgi:hypothetical protein